jgi:PEP-CTERM motif
LAASVCFWWLKLRLQWSLYSNTSNPVHDTNGHNVVFDPGTVQVGNQVRLAGTTFDRILQSFSIDYVASASGASFTGTPMIELRLYDNTGVPNNGFPTPGNLFFDSGTFSLTPAGLGEHSITYSVAGGDFPSPGLQFPVTAFTTMTFSLQFLGLGPGDHIGLTLDSPPTVGSNDGATPGIDGNYWEKDGSTWFLKSENNGIPPVDFAAQMLAVPEPSSIALMALGAFGMLAVIRSSRRGTQG